MKTFFAVSLLLLSYTAHSQMKQGSWELSTSVMGGSMSYSAGGGSTFSLSYFSLSARPGYYILDGFAIEPEFQVYAIESLTPGFIMSGNVSYSYCPPEAVITPFVLAGYGISNSVPFLASIANISGAMDVGALNLGAGGKLLLAEQVAIRFEYRFQQFTYTEESTTTKWTYNYHTGLIGISLFLP